MGWDGGERRKFPRVVFPCKIVVGSPIRLLTTHTENIGGGGIRVILEEKLDIFTVVGLELFLEREKPIKCRGRIKWVVEKVNPLERYPLLFDTGIEFVEISDCDREYVLKLINKIVSQNEGKQ